MGVGDLYVTKGLTAQGLAGYIRLLLQIKNELLSMSTQQERSQGEGQFIQRICRLSVNDININRL